MKVTKMDFDLALEEVHPKFGVDGADLEMCYRGGVIDYGGHLRQILHTASNLFKQVESSERTPLLSLLLEGPPGAGKTALASSLAVKSEFPFVKLISPDNLVGYSEQGKAQVISKTFDDAGKSPLSVVLVDNLERLLEYVRIGPRFSNLVLQTLLVCIKKAPKNGKMMVIATTSNAGVMESLELLDVFNVVLTVPALQAPEVENVLASLGHFKSQAEMKEATAAINEDGIPIKKLLLVVEMALQDSPVLKAGRFVECLREVGC